MKKNNAFMILLAMLVFIITDMRGQSLQFPIPNPYPSAGDQFGAAAASFGNRLAVGAPGADISGPDAGIVYLFDFDSSACHVLRTFQNPEPESGEGFGAAVAYCGDRLLIGAPHHGQTGAAYLFDAMSGKLIAKFVNPLPDTGAAFGYSVAIAGDKYLVGAPNATLTTTGALIAGAVYCFDEIHTGPVAMLKSPNAQEEDLFGWSLAVAANVSDPISSQLVWHALIGAPNDDSAAENAGAAYLFDLCNGNLLNTFVSPTPVGFDSTGGNFGIAVASVGCDWVIGAPLDGFGNADFGYAYLFSGKTYELEHSFRNPSLAPTYFGYKVASLGYNVLVAAPWELNTGAENGGGAVHLFDGASGNLLESFQKEAPEDGDLLGLALTAIGGVFFAGAPGDNFGADDAGAVYLFIPDFDLGLVKLELPSLEAMPGDTIAVPIMVSSKKFQFGFAQFVVDYDSQVLKFIDAELGSAVSDFTLLTQDELPFGPVTPGTDKNVLVQISSVTNSFTGEAQEVVVLKMGVVGHIGQVSPLAFDPEINHTTLTTVDDIDINNGYLELVYGRVAVGHLLNVSGGVSYLPNPAIVGPNLLPVPGVDITIIGSETKQSTTTDHWGNYFLADVPQDTVTIIASKSGDVNNAVTGADALKTLRAVAFLDSLDANQACAADVDLSGEVSGADALSILRYLAFIPQNTGHTSEWLFKPAEHNFFLSVDTTADFGAVVLGDVNLNWFPSFEDSTGVNQQMRLSKGATVAKAEVKLPSISPAALPSDNIISIPVKVSTDSSLGFVQVVMDYDNTVLQFVDARLGKDAAGFNLQVNSALPFKPSTPTTNANVLAQISSISKSIKGNDKEVIVLRLKVLAPQRTSLLAIDPAPARTTMTTVNNQDIRGNLLKITNGGYGVTTAVEEKADNTVVPQDFSLSQNYPNPFNPETTISYTVPASASKTRVTLRLYNTQGQLVRTLVDGEKVAGRYQVVWDGKNDAGAQVSSGVYFYTMRAGSYKATMKMIAVK
ncbi:MAG: cohesin domain-containing protein [candidate division KSB1 bacterium]|nr:cohesin domain-containing protein [candidate division KSB1 bacterium]MDZ7369429.1 cohesin domain-containing protein [candidate division KSB1 bacterium]MDZ7404960.1 cohesin domain-containing protein [candidate division KSB1 bacterium]